MDPQEQMVADQLTTRLQSDPIAGPLLRQQAAKQPFDAQALDSRIKQLGITIPQGMWVSGGKVQHESMAVDNFGKAVLIGSGAAVGGAALGSALGAGGAASTAIPAGGIEGLSASAPTIAGVTGGSGAAVAGGAAASASPSILSRAAGIGGKVAPVLGQAAKGMADSQQANNQQSLANANYNLNAPAKRLSTGIQASIAKNAKPVQAQWGGPGSGLRGESVHFNNAPGPDLIDDSARKLAQGTLEDQLAAQMTGSERPQDPGKTSGAAGALGGASLFASILAALRAKREAY